jgi:hypothetical protein
VRSTGFWEEPVQYLGEIFPVGEIPHFHEPNTIEIAMEWLQPSPTKQTINTQIQYLQLVSLEKLGGS